MESQPASPGFGASLQLKDCIEELLRFTLVSSIDGTLEIDLGLSKDYCSTLLQEDPSDPFFNPTGLSEGVPSYPLYKRLAASLYEAISSEALPRTENKLAVMQETSSMKQMEEEWASLIREKGSHLLNVLKSVDFELHVQEPYFSLLRNGQKTVEGRCAVGHYNKIEPGSSILINKCLVLQVQDVHHYHSFHEMLEAESLKEVLPGVDTTEEGVQVYRRFYSEEKERSNGVLAISVKKLVSQPSIDLSSMLSTKGCTLTDGARALSKHVNRSSDRYWGSFSGSDSDKNRNALDVIRNLITRSCWMNVHIVPPHGVVFEIRVVNGYGARWSKDGSKFIGFLEPYMEDGHSKGWRH
ncbi:uncharacterized protein LOC125874970 isoform X2 [Solanum stenotomum]|uniref:uncharacterized protein LOC125874970 isoform X2 n=1 Tax=Solanum stenotomum TaxID=172797 RepID=UPI0020D07357|nr:uncharacterized protein LOC125874970 isoform X2 [Solanum stenotomum]